MRAFSSAYPGSMFEREDGDYIERSDAASLAEALLEIVKKGSDRMEDLAAQLAEANVDLDFIEKDLKGLVIRLICEPEDSHAPETREILGRWMPGVKKELGITE